MQKTLQNKTNIFERSQQIQFQILLLKQTRRRLTQMSAIKTKSNTPNSQLIAEVQDYNKQNVQQFQPPSQSSRLFQQYQHKFTSPFFQDHNEEEYVIHRAFNTNNFTYLRKLPDNMKHGDLLNERKQKVAHNSINQTMNRTKDYNTKLLERQSKITQKRRQQIGTLGFFTPFQYTESNYEMPKIIDSLQRIQNEHKRKQISDLEFRPSGIQAKMKYQDPFKFIDKSKQQHTQISSGEYLYPFHLPEDTFDAFHESELRRKIISESLRIDGQFLPAKKQQTLSKVGKQNLTQIIGEIELFLKKYLKEIGFFIGVTTNDHIEILFEEKYKNDGKVSMVMSKICEHEMICRFVLRRNCQKWNIVDKKKGFIVYCLLPNWVKNPQQKLRK